MKNTVLIIKQKSVTLINIILISILALLGMYIFLVIFILLFDNPYTTSLIVLATLVWAIYKIKTIIQHEINYLRARRLEMDKFSRLQSKTKTYLVIAVASCLLTLFFGFRDSGNVTYRGSIYEAGSVFSHDEYSISGFGSNYDNKAFGEVGKTIWGDSQELNDQLKALRRSSFIMVIIFGLTTLIFGYLLWKDEGVFDLFIK